MKLEIYKVVIDNIERNVLSLIPHDDVFKNGLPNKGIIGYVTSPLNSLSPDNVYLNPNFIKLFHKIIKETSVTEESFKLSAQRQKQGYVYIIGLLWYENQSVKQKFHNPAQTPATRLYN